MPKSSDMWARAFFYATLGFTIPVSAVAGYFVGHFLDHALHTGEVLSAVCIFAGTAAGIWEVVMLITRQEKNAGNGRDDGAN
ncbi:MAG: AtpZ/AtpI family protein [Terriglobia bacterium]